MTIKLGPKNRHVQLPDGWSQVTSGVCVAGDKFINAPDFIGRNRVVWENVGEDEIGDSVSEDTFLCLIRKTSL